MNDKTKYILIYIFAFTLTATIINSCYNDSSLLMIHLATAVIYSSIIFVFSFYYDFTNMIDVCWTSLGYLLIVNSFRMKWVDTIKKASLNTDTIIITFLFLIILYSSRMTIGYMARGFHGIKKENEDFRYKEFESNCKIVPKFVYWIINYVCLHIIPISILALSHLPAFESIEYLTKNPPKHSILAYLGLTMTYLSLFIETIADEQLNTFRQNKKLNTNNKDQKKVMDKGLWAWIRHPNYLGEIMFHWGIFIAHIGVMGSIGVCVIGPIMMTGTFLGYSIPAMDRFLTNRYKEEYIKYKKNTYRLIPGIF